MLRLALACLLLGLVAAPAANAASTTQILRDCADDGVLQGDYTPSELRRARQNIPADTDEYTDCRDVLARAAASGTAGRGGSGAGGGSSAGTAAGEPLPDPNTPEGREIVGQAGARPAPGPIDVDGRQVVPGTAGLAVGGVRNDLPATLPVVLALLAAAALAASAPSVRRHVLARLER